MAPVGKKLAAAWGRTSWNQAKKGTQQKTCRGEDSATGGAGQRGRSQESPRSKYRMKRRYLGEKEGGWRHNRKNRYAGGAVVDAAPWMSPQAICHVEEDQGGTNRPNKKKVFRGRGKKGRQEGNGLGHMVEGRGLLRQGDAGERPGEKRESTISPKNENKLHDSWGGGLFFGDANSGGGSSLGKKETLLSKRKAETGGELIYKASTWEMGEL